MIRVAGYCRVSTDREDQSNSFEAQQRYFRDYIASRSDWELYEIYADEGITGTSTRRRAQFNRMIRDAHEGRFRMIITKEVSRFSRNILDTIAYTRELKAIGIGVIFATDRINTLEPEAEMLLSFLASLAQEESRRTSSRVVWGQTRQMEQGVVFGQSLLGYDVKDGVLTVNPEGAEIVRLIFHKYGVEQVSASEIARYLTGNGYRTSRGNTCWKAGTVIKILNNEKYVGDLIQKKTYTPDFLTHTKKANRGEVPLVILRNHHEPIISRELWNCTQQQLRKRSTHTADIGHSCRYLFSGKIRCGQCGAAFVGRFRYRKDRTRIRRWRCGTAVREGREGCTVGKVLGDEDALLMLKIALRSLPADTDAIVRNVTALALDAIRGEEPDRDLCRIQKELARIKYKKESAMDSCFSGVITKEDLQTILRRYDQQTLLLQKQLQEKQTDKPDLKTLEAAMEAELNSILRGENESELFYRTLLDRLTVFRDRHMELCLKELPMIFCFTE